MIEIRSERECDFGMPLPAAPSPAGFRLRLRLRRDVSDTLQTVGRRDMQFVVMPQRAFEIAHVDGHEPWQGIGWEKDAERCSAPF